jgi:polyphosphate kinase 2 (PPK2 family)
LFNRVDEKAVARAFDEINEFEAQQRDYGTLILKLYFDVSAEVQEERLKQRGTNPWYRVVHREEPFQVSDLGYSEALRELLANTDTRWSPWQKIDGDDEHEAAVAALNAIAGAWNNAMPSDPPHLVANNQRG